MCPACSRIRPVSSVGRAFVWRSRGTGFNSQCLPVLGMGSPTVVNGRGVGSRAAPVALRRSRSPPVNGTTWTRVEGRNKKKEKKECSPSSAPSPSSLDMPTTMRLAPPEMPEHTLCALLRLCTTKAPFRCPQGKLFYQKDVKCKM